MKAAILKNGVFGVIEAPKEPNAEYLYGEYGRALTKAIEDTFVPFEDQERSKLVFMPYRASDGMKSIPNGYEVEIMEVNKDFRSSVGSKKVAILKKKEEVKEETQEELWDAALTDAIESVEGAIIGYDKIKKFLSSNWTITRNK